MPTPITHNAFLLCFIVKVKFRDTGQVDYGEDLTVDAAGRRSGQLVFAQSALVSGYFAIV